MFSSKSKDLAQAAPPQPQAAMASQKQQGRPMARPGSAPSIISADLVVNGSLTSVGDIQIDGRVEGDVRGAGLVLGEKALVHGEVYAEDLTVRGRIEGGIRARKVLLCSGCHVEGNILHEAFAVETGAFFEGNCRHSDDPLAEQQPRRTEFPNRPQAPPPASPAPTASASGLAAVARPLSDSGMSAAVRPAPTSLKS